MCTSLNGRRAIRRSKTASTLLISLLLSGCFLDDNDHSNNTGPSNPIPESNTLALLFTASDYASINRAITLSAAGSTTESGHTLTYQWQIVDEPSQGAGKISVSAARSTRFIASEEGNYTIKLTISDGKFSRSGSKTIHVDIDGDGIPSDQDLDIDGDGVLNSDDQFPENTAEWIDSDGNGVGNYAQADEDGDGEPDQTDAYPFNPEKKTLFSYQEQEFNGNLYPNGNNLNQSYPFEVTGVIASGPSYNVDTDYFLFEGQAGDIITLLLHKTSPDFQPTLALLNGAGASLPTVKIAWQSDEHLAVSSRLTADGTHAFSVADLKNAVSEHFSYTVSVFKDSDMDGLADVTELALGMQPTNPDSDGDGILDGLEQLLSLEDFDQDRDNLPTWWDLDSDGDWIDDAIEGVTDIDDDGIANFVDVDSDGNGILDELEIGIDPTMPDDSDHDSVLDFADTDDDNDNISDINDDDRQSALKQAELHDKTERLTVTALSVITTQGSQSIDGIARKGDTIHIRGEGFGDTPIMAWQQDNKLFNFTPNVEDDGSLSFIVPNDVQSGVIRISNGQKISYPQAITIVDSTAPLIFSVMTENNRGYTYAGEMVRLEGVNLHSPNTRISLNGVALTAQATTATSVTVSLPIDAASGIIAVVTDQASNWLPIEIRQQTNGMVTLPTASTLTLNELVAEFLGTAEANITADGNFILPTRNQGPTTVHIFAPEKENTAPSLLLSAVVLPGQATLNISPYTMAAGLVYSSMGLEATIHHEDQLAAMDLLVESTRTFGDYLDTKLGQDPYYLEDYRRADFNRAFLSAIEMAGSAIDTAITKGQLREKSTSSSIQSRSNTVVAFSSQSGQASVSPQENQQDFVVTLQRAGDSYNGQIDIENDTLLFADYQLLNAYNGKLIRDHANSYFSSELLGPQNGIFSFYNASVQTEDMKHRSADIRLYTPGFKEMGRWSDYYHSPSYKLAIRTFMSQAMVPIVNTVVGVKLQDSTTQAVLDTFFKWGVFDGIEAGWGKGTANGFADGIGTVIDKTTTAMLEDVVKIIAREQGAKAIKKMAVALGIKLTPWGSAATVIDVGGTAIDLGKLAVDISSTNSFLEYRVIFPISVEDVTPSVIMVDGEQKEVALKGKGLDPVIQNSIFGNNRFKPSVTFTGSEKLAHTDDAPTYESYWVAAGATAPVSPLKVRLPANYLEKAESPLTISLKHYLVDRNPFSDDLIDVELDTQFSIELVKELTLSSITPDKAAWGDTMAISGAGFSKIITNNSVYFTGEEGAVIAAMITNATPTELTVVIPHDAASGPVWAKVVNAQGDQESNSLPFELEQQNYLFTFGDNGSANDDTYALYVNGQLWRTMPSPSRQVAVEVPLTPGIHSVELHGITAPDRIGTYYISFPSGVTLISGDAMSGSDLTAGKVKYYSVEVQAPSPAQMGIQNRMSQSVKPVKIIWQE
ncbi:hypothetical protein L4D09_03895 [Photobacterium makurazakiensis]|uniref:IPT/TIG domain-containing protein n=1 Tax=Photobacterium makurazakiensis TaxID=2910234 RepID=UPI003D143753